VRKKFDPYEALGVAREAEEAEIRAAARRAAKDTHPDAGGDAEAFNDTRRALAILTDPKRRAKFDRTGEAEDVEPDNTEAAAMSIIEGELAALMNAFLSNDFNPMLDPRKIDLVKHIEGKIGERIAGLFKLKLQAQSHARVLRDVAERFSRKKDAAGKFNFISRSLENQSREIERKLEEIILGIDNLKAAKDMVSTYEFRTDPAYGAAFFR